MVNTKYISKKPKANRKSKHKANGAPKPQSTPLKPPAQPAELSESDRARIKEWLQKQAFGIKVAPLSKKRKRSANMQIQTDIFDERLDVQYEVQPKDMWECLRRYKKFTIGSESIAVGQCILVKHDESDQQKIDVAAQWKAKVLEVRALDSEHVYIRVAWVNRPEDLPGGRKPHHGQNELIPTNQIDIVDAMTVNGSLEVRFWDENDESSKLRDDEFFWRQTYDFVNSKTFSALGLMCIDNQPQNPDEMILRCGNRECERWQHVKCIAEEAVQKAAREGQDDDKPTPKKAKSKHVSISPGSNVQAKAQSGSFTAEVLIKGEPNSEGQTPAEHSEIIITGADGTKHPQPLKCLFCRKDNE